MKPYSGIPEPMRPEDVREIAQEATHEVVKSKREKAFFTLLGVDYDVEGLRMGIGCAPDGSYIFSIGDGIYPLSHKQYDFLQDLLVDLKRES